MTSYCSSCGATLIAKGTILVCSYCFPDKDKMIWVVIKEKESLQKELQAAREEIERLKTKTVPEDWYNDVVARNVKLVKELKEYGMHKELCRMSQLSVEGAVCNCGLEAALQAVE